MFKSRDRRKLDERLDRFGREVLRSAASGAAEAEPAAASPFLYARVRARIAAERERLEAGENWLSLLMVARRAMPAMALSAAVAFGVFWFGGGGALTQPAFDDETLFAVNDTRMESVVFGEREALSNDDMFDSIMSGEEAETSR